MLPQVTTCDVTDLNSQTYLHLPSADKHSTLTEETSVVSEFKAKLSLSHLLTFYTQNKIF